MRLELIPYKRYFTGKPCKQGHIAERLISNRVCIECARVKKLDWAFNNQEKVNEKSRLRRMNNPEASKIYDYSRYRDDPSFKMLTAAKQRAKAKNLEFNIDIGDIIIPKFCPLLNIPIFVTDNKVGANSPTIDRIKNELGYVKGNVIVISHIANRCKQNLNSTELFKLAENLKKLEEKQMPEWLALEKGFI